jgi:hypothetical protein
MSKQYSPTSLGSKVLGYSLLSCSGTFLIPIVINFFSALRKEIQWSEAAALSLVALLVVVQLIFIAFYTLWMYPNFSISANGLTITSIFLRKEFNWDEIENIERISRKQLIMIINRKGLFYYRLYGFLRAKKFNKAVIFYISDRSAVDNLENEINKFRSAQVQ